MRLRLMINSFIGPLLLLVLCMVGQQARAQNQTPANIAPVAPVTSVGEWTDPATGLTWTTEDNGSPVDWNQATTYCTNLRLGGYTDWRLPTIDELQSIYDASANVGGNHVKGNLKIDGVPWSSTQKNSEEAWRFNFVDGQRYAIPISHTGRAKRALCVRR